MALLDRFLKNDYEKRYMDIAMPASVECIFMNVLAAADLIMVGFLGAVSIAGMLSGKSASNGG